MPCRGLSLGLSVQSTGGTVGRILQEHGIHPRPQADPRRPRRGGAVRRAHESLQVKKGSAVQDIKKLAQRGGGSPRVQAKGTPGPWDPRGLPEVEPHCLILLRARPSTRECPASEGCVARSRGHRDAVSREEALSGPSFQNTLLSLSSLSPPLGPHCLAPSPPNGPLRLCLNWKMGTEP